MVLSKRERLIAVAAFAGLAALLLDRLVLGPVMERGETLATENRAALAEMARAGELFERGKALSERWRRMQEAGLALQRSEAETAVLRAVRDWSQAAGLTVSSIRPERAAAREGLEEIVFQASGAGPLNAVSGFLYRLETSPAPVRMTEFQLGARKEGTDDLSIQFRLSALCRPAPKPEGKAAAATGTSPGGTVHE